MFDAGNCEIFNPDILLKSYWMGKSASKIIQNDTDIEYELYNFPIENLFLNFCMGKP